MRSRLAAWVTVIGIATVGSAGRAGAQQPPAFRSGVQLLEVDARVFDRRGRFVTDLMREDFEILEQGVPQRIETFLLVGRTRGQHAASAGRQPLPAAPHTWIIVFDQRHMNLNGFVRARRAVESFLAERFRRGDLAGIVFNDRMIGDRLSSNHAEMMSAIRKITAPEEHVGNDAEIRAIRNAIGTSSDGPTTSAEMTLRTLYTLARGLAAVPGPKTVVLLSDGLGLGDWKTLTSISGTLRNTVGHLARAGARVYALDTRGLAGAPDHGLNSLAIDTGGIVIFNENNLGRALDDVAADTNTYYVLGYQPSNTNYDGKYREIEVRVKRPDVKVRARKGYLALPPARMNVPKPVR